jgi:ABC-type branched-subunit amino acid transport system permease subunit
LGDRDLRLLRLGDRPYLLQGARAYFVIVTISFAEAVRLVALNWDELTQGPMALNNIPPLTLSFPGLFEFSFIGKVANYYLVLVAAIIAYVVIARLVYSRAGRAMIALRENEPLATSVGIEVTRYLVLSAVVSAAIAGMAGALYAQYIQIIDPNIFLFIYTVTMVIMVVVGGKGILAGPIVGGLIFGLLPEALRSFAARAFGRVRRRRATGSAPCRRLGRGDRREQSWRAGTGAVDPTAHRGAAGRYAGQDPADRGETGAMASQ